MSRNEAERDGRTENDMEGCKVTGQGNGAEMTQQCAVPAHIRIGTRGSALALAQTDMFIERLRKVYPMIACEKVIIKTAGDKILDKPLMAFGGKAVFVSEFEDAILNGTIDYAVHSAKDMPMELAEGLAIACVLPREDVRDVLLTRCGTKIEELPRAVIGTGSLRRQSQITALYGNVHCESLRGNVTTRIQKLKDGGYDGILLAAAGLRRLGLGHDAELSYQYLDVEKMLPAGGQGIIAVEGRAEGQEYLQAVTDERSALALCVERDILKRLDAGCHEAVGVYAKVKGRADGVIAASGVDGEMEASGVDRTVDASGVGGTVEVSGAGEDTALAQDTELRIRIFKEQDGVLCRREGTVCAAQWQTFAAELVQDICNKGSM